MAKRAIIEVRINEYAGRTDNPNVPWQPDEIAQAAEACRAAGASIVHFHARRSDGSPSHDVEAYAATIRAIRAASDLLVHPTLGQITVSGDQARMAAVEALALDPATRPDFAPIDMGSTNIDVYDPAQKRFRTAENVYINSAKTLAYFAARMRELGVKPHLHAWNVPFMRTIEAFVDARLVNEPVLAGIVLTEGGLNGGHPGTIRGLEAMVDFLRPGPRVEWTVMCKHGNVLPVAAAALERGGHVSIGLGDYPYLELGAPTNAEVVKEVARMARSMGRQPASPQEVRAMLGMG
jgi:uncharacterized protein (DUF849 family)